MKLHTYLTFDGRCREAFEFYARCLDGRMKFMMTNAETPMAKETPPDQQDRIMHATLVFGDQALMGSDAPPEWYSKSEGFSVSISVEEPAEAERIFTALSENGIVKMPIQETFWAQRFGMFTDKFGIPWMVNCEKSY